VGLKDDMEALDNAKLALVRDFMNQGHSWSDLGRELGITRQSAREKYEGRLGIKTVRRIRKVNWNIDGAIFPDSTRPGEIIARVLADASMEPTETAFFDLLGPKVWTTEGVTTAINGFLIHAWTPA